MHAKMVAKQLQMMFQMVRQLWRSLQWLGGAARAMMDSKLDSEMGRA